MSAMTSSRSALQKVFIPAPDSPEVEWRVAEGLVAYEEALALMEARAEAIASGEASERVWLLEHPPLYTAGTSARAADLLEARFPVHKSGRARKKNTQLARRAARSVF